MNTTINSKKLLQSTKKWNISTVFWSKLSCSCILDFI